MSYVRRTNLSIAGLGCSHCGGEGDCFDSPAYGYSAVNSARDQAGIDYTAMGMPSQTQVLAANSRGGIQPLTLPMNYPSSGLQDQMIYPMTYPASNPQIPAGIMPPPGGLTANNAIPWVGNGYPQSLNEAVNRPGTMANALTQTSPDYPTPTALTVSQAFQSAVPGDAQPGHVSLPGLNWTANNTSFVKPVPVSTQCKVSSWINDNPMLLVGGVFALFYLTSQHMKKSRRTA